MVIEHRVGIRAEHVDRVLVLDAQGGISFDGPPALVLEQAREQLIAGGVWVPGYLPYPPRQEQGADASPGPGGLARVCSLRPVTSAFPPATYRRQRKERSRAIAAGQVPSLDLPAVAQGINLTLAAGEHLALLGPDGSGKSTLALTLAGLLYPAGGQVFRP